MITPRATSRLMFAAIVMANAFCNALGTAYGGKTGAFKALPVFADFVDEFWADCAPWYYSHA
jgi:hypothetical protein